MKHQWMTAIFCLVCPLSSMAAITTVMPTALTGPLTNPGMGVASFHQGYGEKLPLTEYPDTGIEYERFTGAIWSPRKASIILRGWMTLLSTQRHIGRP